MLTKYQQNAIWLLWQYNIDGCSFKNDYVMHIVMVTYVKSVKLSETNSNCTRVAEVQVGDCR